MYSAPNLESTYIKKLSPEDEYLARFLHDLQTWTVNNSELSFDQVIDAFVFEVYFSEHMKDNDINIIEELKRLIKEVSGGKEFESFNEVEKETISRKVNEMLLKPDNQIRNRIKLFPVKSPDILKPILES